jgi:hypothetical protein
MREGRTSPGNRTLSIRVSVGCGATNPSGTKSPIDCPKRLFSASEREVNEALQIGRHGIGVKPAHPCAAGIADRNQEPGLHQGAIDAPRLTRHFDCCAVPQRPSEHGQVDGDAHVGALAEDGHARDGRTPTGRRRATRQLVTCRGVKLVLDEGAYASRWAPSQALVRSGLFRVATDRA